MSYGWFPTCSVRAMCPPLHAGEGRAWDVVSYRSLTSGGSESGVARYAGGCIVRGKSEGVTVARLGERKARPDGHHQHVRYGRRAAQGVGGLNRWLASGGERFVSKRYVRLFEQNYPTHVTAPKQIPGRVFGIGELSHATSDARVAVSSFLWRRLRVEPGSHYTVVTQAAQT